MKRTLPPLNALRSFDAAARHMSFSNAADELCVTTGAVSRQVRLLESFLGHGLFERGHRKVTLTPLGKTYSEFVRELFAKLEHTTDSVFDLNQQRPLHVWCPMIFAMRWLLPSLPEFYARQPQIEVKLTTSAADAPTPASLGFVDGIQAAIRRGNGDFPNLHADRLMRSELIPVCSQRLLQHGPPLNCVEDLAHHTLLCSLMRPNSWDEWLKAAGGGHVKLPARAYFENSCLAYQAAIEGMGVALGQSALIEGDIQSGRLVTPLDFHFNDEDAFYLIYPRHVAGIRAFRRFRDWVVGEWRDGAAAKSVVAASARAENANRAFKQ
jgi:LysR family glycine cleavage system transcriptional activator